MVSDVGRWLAGCHNNASKLPVTQTRKSTIHSPYEEFAPLNLFDPRNVKDAVGVYKIARRSRIQRSCSVIEESMPDTFVEQLKLEMMLEAAT